MSDIFSESVSPVISKSLTTPEPVSTPVHVLPHNTPHTKLSKGAIVGIVIGSLVGFGIILFLIIYFAVLSKSNNGNSMYGAIQYTNNATGAAGPFKPRDVILVKYLPKKLLNNAKISVSTDNSVTFTNLPITKDSTNTALWTIPDTVFSDLCLFKVEDGNVPKDFIKTDFFSVIPQILLISGPGSSKLDSVYIGVNANVQLDFDSVISDLSVPSDWILEFSETQKFTAEFTGDVKNVSTTSVVTWVATTIPKKNVPYYWRLRTTALKAIGYPEELSVESNNPVQIINAPPPPPGTLSIGMIDNISGKAGYYVPGDGVTIRVLDSSDITGIVFTYFDGSATQPLTPTGPGVVVSPGVTEFPWTIPDTIFTDNFSVTATLHSETATVKGVVEPEFTWDQPVGGTTVNTYVAAAPFGNTIRTTVAYRGSLAFDNWEVGYVDQAGALQPFGTKTQAGDIVTIDWVVTQEKLGLDPTQAGLPNNTVNYLFYVKVSNNLGQTVVIKSPADVTWFGSYWVPTLSMVKTSQLPSTPYMITANTPPVEGNILEFTGDTKQATQCFSVPVNTTPGQFSYLVYVFPAEHPLPQTFNFFLIQTQGTQGPVITKNYNQALAEISPFNRTSNPPIPYGIAVVSDSREGWDINPSNVIFFTDLEFREPHIFDFGAIMPNINIFG